MVLRYLGFIKMRLSRQGRSALKEKGVVPQNRVLIFETSSGFGGSSNALANLVNHLNRERFLVTVAITHFGPQVLNIKNAEIVQVAPCREPKNFSKFGFFFYFFASILPSALRIYLLAKRKNIALCHINTNIMLGFPAIIASRFAGIPCVCHIRETRRLIGRERVFARWVQKFILINSRAIEVYRRDLPESKIAVVHDGVDLERFSGSDPATSFRERFNIGRAPVIALVGRIVAGKGHKEFILAAKEVLVEQPDAKFLIIGDAKGADDQYFSEVKRLVVDENLQESIIFTGWIKDIREALIDLDILVQATTTFPEGFGLTIAEAMALGKPVIATDIPGPSDIVVDGQTGFLVSAGDVKAMAEKILFLLNNPAMAKSMGEEGRKRVDELFDIKKQVRKIEDLYEEVLSSR